jgi:hypothetical protein
MQRGFDAPGRSPLPNQQFEGDVHLEGFPITKPVAYGLKGGSNRKVPITKPAAYGLRGSADRTRTTS